MEFDPNAFQWTRKKLRPGEVVDLDGDPVKYEPLPPRDQRTIIHPLDPHYDPPLYDLYPSYRFSYRCYVRPDAEFRFRRIKGAEPVS